MNMRILLRFDTDGAELGLHDPGRRRVLDEARAVKGREPMRVHLGIVMAGMLAGVVTAALAQQSSASSKDQQLITELAKKWEAAYNRKDAAGVAALHTESAVEVAPTGIFQGRAAIQKRIDDDLKAGGHGLSISVKSVQSTGDVIMSSGDWNGTYGSQAVHGYWGNSLIRSTSLLQQNSFNLVTSEPGAAQPSSK
jgi:ketosteroid isomerase-like protein